MRADAAVKCDDVLNVLRALNNGEICSFFSCPPRGTKCVQIAVMKCDDVLNVLRALNNGEMCVFSSAPVKANYPVFV